MKVREGKGLPGVGSSDASNNTRVLIQGKNNECMTCSARTFRGGGQPTNQHLNFFSRESTGRAEVLGARPVG